jgi:hypothetical protein
MEQPEARSARVLLRRRDQERVIDREERDEQRPSVVGCSLGA